VLARVLLVTIVVLVIHLLLVVLLIPGLVSIEFMIDVVTLRIVIISVSVLLKQTTFGMASSLPFIHYSCPMSAMSALVLKELVSGLKLLPLP